MNSIKQRLYLKKPEKGGGFKFQKPLCWNYPPPSNSHHQDYSIFSRESLQTFICDCYWVGGRPNPFIVYYTHMFDISIYSVGKVVIISHQDCQMSLTSWPCFTPLGPTCHHPKPQSPQPLPTRSHLVNGVRHTPGEWFAACSIFRPSSSTVGSFEAEKISGWRIIPVSLPETNKLLMFQKSGKLTSWGPRLVVFPIKWAAQPPTPNL